MMCFIGLAIVRKRFCWFGNFLHRAGVRPGGRCGPKTEGNAVGH